MSSSLSVVEIPTRTQTPRPIEEISSESTGEGFEGWNYIQM